LVDPVRFHDTDYNIDKIAEDRLKEAFKKGLDLKI